MKRTHHRGQVLRVEAFGERGRSDQVDIEGGDEAVLDGAEGDRLHRGTAFAAHTGSRPGPRRASTPPEVTKRLSPSASSPNEDTWPTLPSSVHSFTSSTALVPRWKERIQPLHPSAKQECPID